MGSHLPGAHELTLMVEGSREFRWLTDQCGAVGTHTLAEWRVVPIQQVGSMPHALIYVEIVWVITQSELPTDLVAMDPFLVADRKPDWTTTRAERVDAYGCPRDVAFARRILSCYRTGTSALRPSTRNAQTIAGHPFDRMSPRLAQRRARGKGHRHLLEAGHEVRRPQRQFGIRRQPHIRKTL